MAFLRNCWYAGAWSDEVARKPIGRKILGEEVTFYRTESGRPLAVASRCPHRFAPLHFGDVIGDNLKCRYHGLQFAPSGACAVNPDGSKPPSTCVKVYAVAERGPMIWIWMGDAKPEGEPPDSLILDPSMGGFVYGHLEVKAHFQLVSDNLMDNAHATHLHAAFTTESAVKHPKGEVRQEGDLVYSTTWAPDAPPNPFFKGMYGKPGNVDQWVDFKWNPPATITITAGVTATGGPRAEGVSTFSVHMITPETETSSHYFWSIARDCKLDDHAISEKMQAAFHRIFTEEDTWIMEGQTRMMDGGEFWSLKPSLLAQDKATALVRRHIEKLIAQQEAARQAMTVAAA